MWVNGDCTFIVTPRNKKILIDTSKHLVLESAHPSPLSAYNGFFGSRPFSKANKYLMQHEIEPVDFWVLNDEN